MGKKFLKVILKTIIVILAYVVQIYVLNNITFFGVKADLCLVTVVIVVLTQSGYSQYVVAGICGIASDILFYDTVCKYLIIYIIVVSILDGLKKMYKQDSKLSIIIFTTVGVIASEILMLVFFIIENYELVNIIYFILNVLKQCVVNICLAFGIYLAFRICGKEGD